jgi:hypothetical protein
MNPADLLSAMKRTVEQLAAFNEMAKALTSTLELREVLNLMMHKVSDLLHPRNWALLLLSTLVPLIDRFLPADRYQWPAERKFA